MNIEQYIHYDFRQFIEDSFFRKWVTEPNSETEAFWYSFIETYPHKHETIQEARTFLESNQAYFTRHSKTEAELDAKWKTLYDLHRKTKDRSSKTSKRLSSRWLSAASILLLLSIGTWFFLNSWQSDIVYATDFGEWKTIDLPDGSQVLLNANSELRHSRRWRKGSDRQVELTGEAFFKIEKKPETGASFQVRTEDLMVEVLGTEFNVHARGESTEVFLHEGKVKLEHGEEETMMSPGDFISYSSKKGRTLARHHRNLGVGAPDAWKDGVLIFNDEDAFPILEKIEEIYGVEIEVKNASIYSNKYNVAVPMEDLSVVIPTLEKSMHVEIVLEGTRMILK